MEEAYGLKDQSILFFIPIRMSEGSQKAIGALFIFCRREVEVRDIFYIFVQRDTITINKWLIMSLDKLTNANMKNALVSIMSRNMSHNIGSHILATLGFEGINAADDRVLFKYLQHRMDYIAQVSTEMPTWSSPVWFISDLMKRFYMQTHLLEYIGKSEGLGAKKWNDSEDSKEKGKIVIKIKDSKDPDGIFIISDKDALSQHFDDFQLAIPGGTVGLHAFYTILENIIRNSAKHNWKKDSSQKPDNLEITIEFKNDPDNDFIEFKIYDNVSVNNRRNNIPLHKKMNTIFSTPFIDEESGKLNKENWGLAEMRISAGYLNHKEYQDIGFYKIKNKTAFIKAGTKMDNRTKRLAYEFKVPKPKELLIIGDPYLQKKLKKILKKSSIFVENRIHDKPYEQEIVVIFDDALNGKYKKLEKMPGRIIIVKTNKEPVNLINKIGKDLGIKMTHVVKRKIVILEEKKYNDLKKNLTSLEKDKDFMTEFKIELYKKWVENLISRSGGFYLNLEEGQQDNKISDYLEEQMYQVIRKHVVNTKFLETDCDIKGIDLDNLREEFSKISNIEMKTLLTKETVTNETRRNLKINFGQVKQIGQKLIKKKTMLKDFIFRDDNKVETVPPVLNISMQKGDNSNTWRTAFKELFSVPGCLMQDVDEIDEMAANILYKRHIQLSEFLPKNENIDYDKNQNDNEDVYVESLSGSQFYFTMLYDTLTSRDKDKKHINRMKKIILQLIENALLKCVIIDERVARFLSSSDILQQKFKLLRIQAPFRIHFRGKDAVSLTENSNSSTQTFSDENLTGCDIFIIHQGVLDKMGLNNKEKARKFLEKVKKAVPFVFVTSGRGKPENVPEDVKFLPFSLVDSFLLKEYPEKLLLIQSAMRLNLPKNGESA